MQVLNNRIYVDELINSKGMLVANGVVGQIHMLNSCNLFIFKYKKNMYKKKFLKPSQKII